jgi:outer membrane lipoprotein carrier protein
MKRQAYAATLVAIGLVLGGCGGGGDAGTPGSTDGGAAATLPLPQDSAPTDSIAPPIDMPPTSEPQPIPPGADTAAGAGAERSPSPGGSPAQPPGSPPASPASPATPPVEDPPSVQAQDGDAILQGTAAAYQDLRSMRADFTMLVNNPLLRSRTNSRGTLYQRRPDRIKLDFSEPDGDVIVSDGTYFWLFYPSATPNQVIRTPASQGGASAVDLQAQFVGDPTERFTYTRQGSEEVNGRPAHVFTLVPRQDLGYKQLKVWIDARDALVRQFELTENNGMVRHIELSNIERNPVLGDDVFRFTPPAGVRVVTR